MYGETAYRIAYLLRLHKMIELRLVGQAIGSNDMLFGNEYEPYLTNRRNFHGKLLRDRPST